MKNPVGIFGSQILPGYTILSCGLAAQRGKKTVARPEPDYFHSSFTLTQTTPRLERFSRQEQHIVRSDLFDETSTPRYECLESIPADLFTIATIEFTTPCDDTWSLFSIESLDLMQDPPHKKSGHD